MSWREPFGRPGRGDRVRVKAYDLAGLDWYQQSLVRVFVPDWLQGQEGTVLDPYKSPSMTHGSRDPIVRLDDGRQVAVKTWALEVVRYYGALPEVRA